MNKNIFVTGIGTDVGKTIGSAIICESLQADYWKPIQAGDLDFGDTQKVQSLISNNISQFHANSYALKTPMSPHAAAQIDGIEIQLERIETPVTNNKLVIEGAGGLLVPLNNQQTIIDLINPKDHVILISRHYLGSINHTLMSLELLRQKGLEVSIIFNGEENKSTESIIEKMSSVNVIGRIEQEKEFNPDIIKKYADLFHHSLMACGE